MTHVAAQDSVSTAGDVAVRLLREQLASDDPGASRAALAAASANINERFLAGESVVDLVHLRAAVVDELLVHLWESHANYCSSVAALVAVGGYGRGELHPCSDIDIMLLLPDDLPESVEPELSDFVTALWDVGLEIGHSVRTVDQCLEQAVGDLTVATTLIEARLLDGPVELFESMQAAISPRVCATARGKSVSCSRKASTRSVARNHRLTIGLITGFSLERYPLPWMMRTLRISDCSQ